MKKKLAILFASLLLLVSASPMYAAGHSGHDHDINAAVNNTLEVKLKIPGQAVPYVGEAIFEYDRPAFRMASITVNVTSPVDQKWRSTYQNYAYEANRVVTRAGTALKEQFGINFLSVAQPLWQSSSTTSSGLLNDARNKHGLTYNGNQKADIMIAFSGLKPSDNSNIAGIATLGNPYSTIFDNGYSTNAETTQHEAGHMYGLRHDEEESGSNYDGKNCVMTAVGFGFIDRFCKGHHADWYAARNKY